MSEQDWSSYRTDQDLACGRILGHLNVQTGPEARRTMFNQLSETLGQAASWAEYRKVLRWLRQASGLTMRQLEKRGHELKIDDTPAPSTFCTWMKPTDAAPKWRQVKILVTICTSDVEPEKRTEALRLFREAYRRLGGLLPPAETAGLDEQPVDREHAKAHSYGLTLYSLVQLTQEITELRRSREELRKEMVAASEQAREALTKSNQARDTCTALIWLLIATVGHLERCLKDITRERDELRRTMAPGDFRCLAQIDQLNRQKAAAERCISEAGEEVRHIKEAEHAAEQTACAATEVADKAAAQLRDLHYDMPETEHEEPVLAGQQPPEHDGLPVPGSAEGLLAYSEHTLEHAREVREELQQSIEAGKELVVHAVGQLVLRAGRETAPRPKISQDLAAPDNPVISQQGPAEAIEPSAVIESSKGSDLPTLPDIAWGDLARQVWNRPTVRTTTYAFGLAVLAYYLNSVQTCPTCANSGTITCGSCTNGMTEAVMICPMQCTTPAPGVAPCKVCQGEGTITTFLPCKRCAATAKLPCPVCARRR